MTSEFIGGYEFILKPNKRSEPVKHDSTTTTKAYRLRVGHAVIDAEGKARRIDRLSHTSRGVTYRLEGDTNYVTLGVDDTVTVPEGAAR